MPCKKFHKLDLLMNQIIPQYQVLQGEISQLHTEATHVHYLKNIKQQQKAAGAVAVLQAAVGQAGAVHSAQAATDEGDPVDGFTMQVAGKTVRGSFWKSTFIDGDHVQVIGQERNGIFEAIAVTKPDARVIWMQPHCERGTTASRQSIIKKALIASVLFFTAAPCLAWLMNEPLGLMLMMAAIFTTMVWSVMVLWSWGDFMSFAREMNAVGAALSLPEPENIDLFKSTKQARQKGKPDVPMGVYYY
jgi:hypothetical protein